MLWGETTTMKQVRSSVISLRYTQTSVCTNSYVWIHKPTRCEQCFWWFAFYSTRSTLRLTIIITIIFFILHLANRSTQNTPNAHQVFHDQSNGQKLTNCSGGWILQSMEILFALFACLSFMRNDSIDRTTIEMRLIPMKFHFIVINQMEKLFQLKNLNNTKQVWGFTLRQMFF